MPTGEPRRPPGSGPQPLPPPILLPTQEPFWRGRARQQPKSSEDAAQLASLRNRASSLGKDFQKLLALHERQAATGADLRAKLRAARAEGEDRYKALLLAHRTLDRLAQEKAALEVRKRGGHRARGGVDLCARLPRRGPAAQ